MGKINGRQMVKAALFHGLFPLYYRWCARKPVKNNSLFLEIRYPGLTEDLRLLYEACGKRTGERAEVFCLEAGRDQGLPYIRRCLGAIRRLAVARRVFVDESSNMLSALPVRKETAVVQCWHACGAFKRFGHGLPGGLEEAYYGPYSLVTVSSEEVVDIYRESMRQPAGVVRALGVSRTDRFFDPAFLAAARGRVEKAVPAVRGKRVVLYAPTFRGNVARAQMPEVLDIRFLQKTLPEDCVILYRGHPAVKERVAIPEEAKDFFFDVTDTLLTDDCLCRADACVTDYSSLVFEFALLGKPMVFYVYDLETYDDERGFYYPFRDFAPGPVCKTSEEASEALREALSRKDGTPAAVSAFRKRFMGACDGHATERILMAVEAELEA